MANYSLEKETGCVLPTLGLPTSLLLLLPHSQTPSIVTSLTVYYSASQGRSLCRRKATYFAQFKCWKGRGLFNGRKWACLQCTFYRILFWYFLAFDFCRFCAVIRVFSFPPQRPMTSDFEGFSIPDFIHYIYFPILILRKESVFALFNVEC